MVRKTTKNKKKKNIVSLCKVKDMIVSKAAAPATTNLCQSNKLAFFNGERFKNENKLMKSELNIKSVYIPFFCM